MAPVVSRTPSAAHSEGIFLVGCPVRLTSGRKSERMRQDWKKETGRHCGGEWSRKTVVETERKKGRKRAETCKTYVEEYRIFVRETDEEITSICNLSSNKRTICEIEMFR